MRARLRCRGCGHEWQTAEVDPLAALTCAACGAAADARASEDFASAVEDALAQLWHLGQSFEVTLTLDTAEIPPAFRPPPEGDL